MARHRAVDTKGADTRARILSASMRVIARKGYGGMRLADVAEEAEVSLGLVQHFFATRSELLAATFAVGSAEGLRIANSIVDGPGLPVERLQALVAYACSDGADVADGSWTFWFEFWLAASREPGLSLANRDYDIGWQSAFARVIDEGMADGSFQPAAPPTETATLIVSFLDGAMLRRLLRSPGHAQGIAEMVARLVGIAPCD